MTVATPAALARADAFLSSLRPHSDKPLVFEYGGRRVQAGYHVTEVLAASYRGLDCGANAEAWAETVVQLWDVPGETGETHMTAGKFLSIYEEVASKVGLEAGANLVLECGDDLSPAVRYTVESVGVEGGSAVVRLEPKRASCKPRDRRYESLGMTPPVLAPTAAASNCCGPAATPELVTLEPAPSAAHEPGRGCC